MDKKGNKGKLNIIDGLILLLLIGIIGTGAVAYRYVTNVGHASDGGKIVQYDIELAGKEKFVVDAIQVGDEVKDSVRGNYLGRIVNIQVLPATQIATNSAEGKFVKALIPDKFDVVITLEANGVVTPNRVSAEGVEIKIGKEMFVKGKGYGSQGFVTGIRFDE